MARPQKDGLDYFPHDTDAVNDEKIEALRALHGNDGYAFYFILLERIYRSPNMEIDVSDAETLQILARKVTVTPEKFAEIMQTALKWHCFDPEKYQNHHILTSNGIKKRALPVIEKRVQMRLKYQSTEVPAPVSDAETIPETPQSKVKKSKVKKNKKDTKLIFGEFENVFLTTNEHIKLIKRFGDKKVALLICNLSLGIKSKGYKYKDHYATILNWERRDNNNPTTKRPNSLPDTKTLKEEWEK